ncbi:MULTISPECIES: ribosomal L7Ae/L30e/S12e/Gadd45 family protein [Psychrobacillus]|uniref:Ribosomal L7Ae/L30e/S12e/Gadd45 family protein n=1 Tax=Psychrobacillus faecigallinarum TaxID=2762235 RepID=A0ABR8RBJ7_9BACI|nr:MULTISPECIES: ribosomal L7Ae/L30e/S12e/Gadd45 family protein [Psychrobacillus]MBD7945027.1 ribosomal L7Ae/L30e/S12e/Gadd45 family protein [Psychrobacillus faecigallinarum]QEY21532.1 50S ribosomal protein L7ae-like protein [Psychrobacillus sp. AK 1817]QGM32063.1 50S ribosomal protein L7ae-like protein [Bacillus sp. N3536]
MSYEKVKQADKTIIGTKQAVKAMKKGLVKELYIALDVELRIIELARQIAQENDVPITYVESKLELGRACGLRLSAAVVAITV